MAVGDEGAPAILWVVGTPIGNLGDMTPRGIEVLRGVHAIAAEDTRHTRQLLSHFGIPHPDRMISYREENRDRAADEIMAVLSEGQSVALVTDAGMPAVSDPGDVVVDRCHAAGVRVSVVPGASSVLAALACSGLPSRRFTFEGFLSRRRSHRQQHLNELVTERRTMVFLESPSRITDTLKALRDTFGETRRGCVARELTKKYEEILRGTLSELAAWSMSKDMLGEFTLVVEGSTEAPAVEVPSEEALREEVDSLMAQGRTRRQAAKEVAGRYGLDSRAVYDLSS